MNIYSPEPSLLFIVPAIAHNPEAKRRSTSRKVEQAVARKVDWGDIPINNLLEAIPLGKMCVRV